MRLALFDVDGVLIRTGLRIKERYAAAIFEVFGIEVDSIHYQTSGKTDSGILLDLCTRAGVASSEAEAKLRVLCEITGRWTKQHVAELVKPLPGCRELLSTLQKEGFTLGVVTGNVDESAKALLCEAGLLGFFEVFATGDMFPERRRLLDAAIKQATAAHDPIDWKCIYFDDSPLGVAAGKEAGAFVVGVATGDHSVQELLTAGADVAVTNFDNLTCMLTLLGRHQTSHENRPYPFKQEKAGCT